METPNDLTPETPKRRGRPRKIAEPQGHTDDGPLEGMEVPESVVHSTPDGEIQMGAAAEEQVMRDDFAHDVEIRDKAVKLGLCDLTTAAVLPLDELQEMVKEAEAFGIGSKPPIPAVQFDAAQIIKELLEQLAVRSANGLPMTGNCKRCEMLPAYLQKDCVCHKARAYLEAAHAE